LAASIDFLPTLEPKLLRDILDGPARINGVNGEDEQSISLKVLLRERCPESRQATLAALLAKTDSVPAGQV
jgi:hypothetical protein